MYFKLHSLRDISMLIVCVVKSNDLLNVWVHLEEDISDVDVGVHIYNVFEYSVIRL